MAVNRNFYLTLNELMSRASGGSIAAVVDYSTFVDAGKVLSAMAINDLVNEFLSPLMNKIQKTINDNPSYRGSLVSMYQGSLDYGVLETIMGTFYDMAQSCFDGSVLVNGQTYTDQFKVNLPEKTVLYHTNSDSWGLDITIQDTSLRGAFQSPAAMDRFISSIMIDVANSLEFAKEQARLGTHASMLKWCDASQAESADENKAAVKYNMVSIYNAKFDTNLTADDCLYNDSFVRFLTASIKSVAQLMEKPSASFNQHSDFITFTPKAYARLSISSIFEKAVRQAQIDAYHREDAGIDMEYEALPYWQMQNDRLRITTNTEGSTTYSSPIVACLYDKRAIGEMVQLEDTESTRNAKYKYTNYHFQENFMYWTNDYANAVIFCLA